MWRWEIYSFPRTTEDHIELLVENMREDDYRELDAIAFSKHEAIVRDSCERSLECWSCFAPGGLVAIFGVVPQSLVSEAVVPWILTTKVAEKHKKDFYRASKIAVDFWLKKYGVLENYIDARYERSLRWAEKLGFTIHPAIPYGAYGLPFHKATRRID
jgi:hypothetical protein